MGMVINTSVMSFNAEHNLVSWQISLATSILVALDTALDSLSTASNRANASSLIPAINVGLDLPGSRVDPQITSEDPSASHSRTPILRQAGTTSMPAQANSLPQNVPALLQ